MIRSDDIKKYLRCDRLYTLDKTSPTQPFPLTLQYLKYRKIETQFSKYVIANQFLIFENLEIKVPLLSKKNNKWYLLLPIYKFSEIFYYRHDIEFMYYVLNKLDFQIAKIYAVIVNDDLNLPLFEIKRKDIITSMKLGEKTIKKYDTLIAQLDSFNAPVFRKTCLENGKCPFINQCFNISDHSLVYYRGLNNEEKLKLDLNQEINTNLEPIDAYTFAQIEATKTGLYYDEAKIHDFFKSLDYPLNYIDFEWDNHLNHQSRKREDALFSFSLMQDGSDHHIDIFSFEEIEIIKTLIEVVPQKGSILVYNAAGGELIQLRRMIKKYPQYKKELLDIYNRIVDIQYIFSNGYYYDTRFAGRNGLKHIMKVLPIQSEMDAISTVETYRSMQKCYDEEAVSKILKYNYYDTYALKLIVALLRKTIYE